MAYSRSGHSLKRSTPRMKLHHMNRVLDFRSDLKQRQADGMTEGTREHMLLEIKRMMGATEAHNKWFDGVYNFRRSGDMKTYEAKIKRKYRYLRAKERKASALPPLPCTDGLSPCKASAALSDYITKYWNRIPEVAF